MLVSTQLLVQLTDYLDTEAVEGVAAGLDPRQVGGDLHQADGAVVSRDQRWRSSH